MDPNEMNSSEMDDIRAAFEADGAVVIDEEKIDERRQQAQNPGSTDDKATGDEKSGTPNTDKGTSNQDDEDIKLKISGTEGSEGGDNQQGSGAPGTSTNTQPTADQINSYISEKTGGKIKSIDDVINSLTKPAEAPAYKNELSKQFDEALERGVKPADFMTFLATDVTKMEDPKEVLALKMKWENPDYSAEDINLLIDDKYKQHEEMDDKSKRIGLLQMQQDARAAKSEMTQLQQEKLKGPDGVEPTDAKAKVNQQRIESWKPQIGRIAEDFKTIDLPIGDKARFEYKVKAQPEQVKQLLEAVINSDPSLNFDDAGIKAAKDKLAGLYEFQNRKEIYKAIASKARTIENEQWSKVMHNPSDAKNMDGQRHSEKPMSSDEALYATIVQAEGL